MIGKILEGIWSEPKFTGLSAYLPRALAEITQQTICYDITTVLCLVVIAFVS